MFCSSLQTVCFKRTKKFVFYYVLRPILLRRRRRRLSSSNSRVSITPDRNGFNVYCLECPPGGTFGHPGGQQKKVFAVLSWKGPSGI